LSPDKEKTNMPRKTYPSDISREQFEKIRPELEAVRKQTKPPTLDLYDVLCGVLYVLKSGCQWRMLPSDFPRVALDPCLLSDMESPKR
jgi:transposase